MELAHFASAQAPEGGTCYMQYGHKQAWQTKIVGLAAVVVVNLVAGWALIAGLIHRGDIVEMVQVDAVVIEEAPPPPEDLPPPPPPDLDVPPPPVMEIPLVVFNTPPANTNAIQVEEGDPEAAPPPPPPAPVGPTQGPQRRTRRGELPPYPEASLRLEETGETTVRVCVTIEGDVISAETVNSSGSARLDRAAEQWLRRGRYDPALQNGEPIEACADTIVVWELPEL